MLPPRLHPQPLPPFVFHPVRIAVVLHRLWLYGNVVCQCFRGIAVSPSHASPGVDSVEWHVRRQGVLSLSDEISLYEPLWHGSIAKAVHRSFLNLDDAFCSGLLDIYLNWINKVLASFNISFYSKIIPHRMDTFTNRL